MVHKRYLDYFPGHSDLGLLGPGHFRDLGQNVMTFETANAHDKFRVISDNDAYQYA